MSPGNKQPTLGDVQAFWNRNVCQTEFIKNDQIGSKNFFAEAERIRYKYHYYLPELFDRIAAEKPGGKLLEIGCSMGTDLMQLARRGLKVTGIDLTEAGIDLARQRFALYNQPADLKTGDAENLPFADRTFDIVYSFGVLHHTPDTAKSVAEVHRVLVPGGLAVIMLYHRRSFNYIIHRMLNQPFDGHRNDRCPIERTYIRPEMYTLFKHFSRIELETRYFMTTGFGIIWDMVPMFIHKKFGQKWGWHIIIKAIK
jgi:ubiquinone/menaquinone biosynthesis C-methylase UbiE